MCVFNFDSMFHFFGFEFNKVLILFGLQLPRQACEAPARKLQSEEDQDLEEIEAKKVSVLQHFINFALTLACLLSHLEIPKNPPT